MIVDPVGNMNDNLARCRVGSAAYEPAAGWVYLPVRAGKIVGYLVGVIGLQVARDPIVRPEMGRDRQ